MTLAALVVAAIFAPVALLGIIQDQGVRRSRGEALYNK